MIADTSAVIAVIGEKPLLFGGDGLPRADVRAALA